MFKKIILPLILILLLSPTFSFAAKELDVNHDGYIDSNLLPIDTTVTLGVSDTKIPSQNAVKTYSDTKAPIANPTFTGTVKGIISGTIDNCVKIGADGSIVDSGSACGSGTGMTYPGAGVANSTGSAWGTSYTVGTAANNLVQLDSSGKLPAVDGSALTGISGGVAGKVCKTITNPSDADNVLFDIASTRTITKISGIVVGGTSAVITLQDAGADGSGSTSIDDAITMDTDGANGGTISYAVHDGDIIKLDVGTVTGVVTQLMVCYE